MTEADALSILGLPMDAPTDEVERTARQALARCHPDGPAPDSRRFLTAMAARDYLRSIREVREARLNRCAQCGGTGWETVSAGFRRAKLMCTVCRGARLKKR